MPESSQFQITTCPVKLRTTSITTTAKTKEWHGLVPIRYIPFSIDIWLMFMYTEDSRVPFICFWHVGYYSPCPNTHPYALALLAVHVLYTQPLPKIILPPHSTVKMENTSPQFIYIPSPGGCIIFANGRSIRMSVGIHPENIPKEFSLVVGVPEFIQT